MTEATLLEIIRAGERPGVEFKGARRRNDKSFVEVAKAALGLVNRQDFGYIVIGVTATGDPVGVAEEFLAGWADPDHTRQDLLPYADPPIFIDVHTVRVEADAALAGRKFVVLTVHPFERHPVFCRKDAPDKNGHEYLKAGRCYVRRATLPSTTELAGGEELRELMRVAIARGIREFVTTAKEAGLTVTSTVDTAEAQFRAQQASFDE